MNRLTAQKAFQTATAASRLSARSVRSLHSTPVSRGSSSTSSSHDEETYPVEGFNSPLWKYTVFGLIAGIGYYRLSPSSHSSDSQDGEEQKPWLTRYIQHWTIPSSVWKQRNERHLELAKEKAEEILFLQDAERPPVHRLKYPQSFEMGSPFSIPLGSQADLSDLKIKTSSE